MATVRTAAGAGGAIAAAMLVSCGGSGIGDPPAPPPPAQNSAPTITVNSTASVDENDAGAVITSVETSDADGDTVTVTLDDGRFEISDGNLKLKEVESLDYEAAASVEVTITASDGMDSTTATVTVSVNDVRSDVQFTDVTAASGILFTRGYVDTGMESEFAQDADVREFGGGVAAGDYDNDGWVDLFILRGDVGPNLLYRNIQNNTFQDMAESAGVAFTKSPTENYKHSGPGFADMDGDGHLDLFIGGIEGDPAKIYRNEGDGSFSDVTEGSGLEAMNARYTISSAFGDYDLDGRLDMFLSHWGTARSWEDNDPPENTGNLWRNISGPDGVIRFTDVSIASGISPSIIDEKDREAFDGARNDYTFSPTFARITGDLYPDLVIAGDFVTSRYYANDGDGTFTNATDSEVIIDRNGKGSALGDYDGDGDLDWFVSAIWTDPDTRTERFFTVGNRLYRNNDGVFSDVTLDAGVRDGSWGWGSCFADFDNDGDLDLYQTNGWVPTEDLAAYNFDTDTSRLFISDGEGLFTELSQEAGIIDYERGHGIVCGDFDNDGDVDIFQMHRNQTNAGTVWRNDTAVNNHFIVKLNGLSPNTAAAGARITLTVNGENQLREIMIGSNFTSQNPLTQVFGLGSNIQADLTVEWPDGQITTENNLAANELHTFDHPLPCEPAVAPAVALMFTCDFHRGALGFVADFAEYPPANKEIFKLTSDYRPLPSPLESKSALFISGVNHSADLLMFFKGQIGGLVPGALYDVSVSVEIASDTPSGCFGIGGAPGESVWIKAGATAVEPLPVIKGSYLRMNIDVGNQSVGGDHAAVLGNIANSRICEQSRQWELKSFPGRATPLSVSTSPNGRIWLLFGVDSGFEGMTEVYFTRASVTLRPK